MWSLPADVWGYAGQAVVSALTACLAACQQAPCPDSNLLASDALDVLHKIGAQLSLPGLPPEVPSALLSQLCRALDPQSSPLRLRLTATGIRIALLCQHGCHYSRGADQ